LLEFSLADGRVGVIRECELKLQVVGVLEGIFKGYWYISNYNDQQKTRMDFSVVA